MSRVKVRVSLDSPVQNSTEQETQMSLRTAEGVIAWIEANTPKDPDGTAGQKALWWVAYRSAEQLRDNWDTRDMAHMLMDGIPALTIESGLSDLFSYLDEEDGAEEIERAILEDLQDFWTKK